MDTIIKCHSLNLLKGIDLRLNNDYIQKDGLIKGTIQLFNDDYTQMDEHILIEVYNCIQMNGITINIFNNNIFSVTM